MSFRTVIENIHMPECPRWHDGELWVSDIWGQRVLRLDAAGEVHEMATLPDDGAGLGWLRDGRLLVVGMLERKVYVVDDGKVDVHADLSVINPHMLNDMIVARDGTAYVTGFGWKLWEAGSTMAPSPIIRVRPDGTFAEVSEPLAAPNGIALTEDERRMVVAEPAGGGLSWFTVTDDGDLVDRKFVPLTPAEGAPYIAPDGICLDAEDHVWVADPMNHRVIRVAPDGTTVEDIPFTDGYPLACALGGPDRRTLFVALGGAHDKNQRPPTASGRFVATEAAVGGAGKP